MGLTGIANLAVLLMVLFLACFARQGRDRSAAIHRYVLAIMLAGAAVMVNQRDWWPLALWSLVCINALRKPWPGRQITKLAVGVGLYGMMVALPPVEPFWILTGIATAAFIQAARWWIMEKAEHWNHQDMLYAMGIASIYSLSLLHDWRWLFAQAPLLVMLFVKQKGHVRAAGQGVLWAGAAVVSLVFVSGFWPLSLSVLLLGGIVLGAQVPGLSQTVTGPDHGRVHQWYVLLKGWWLTSWNERLFGLGWDSWRAWADSLSQLRCKKLGIAPQNEHTFSHPHNEYIHVLFEHGIVGLLLLLGWIGALLWHAWLTNPPLLIPALTLCAIAGTSYPWTLPYETTREHKQYIEFSAFGSMGMVVTSVLLLKLLS